MDYDVYKLRDWISMDMITISCLSKSTNSEAMRLLRQYPNEFDWYYLSSNPCPEALELIKENIECSVIDIVNFTSLSANTNPAALELLRMYPEKISWKWLALNPCPVALDIMRKNIAKVDWREFSANQNPEAIEFLIQHHPNKIYWPRFLTNICVSEEAMKFIEENVHKLCFSELSANPSPETIRFLKRHFNRIDWYGLSRNPSPEAIELLRLYPNNIKWYCLAQNKNPLAIKILRENSDKLEWCEVWCHLSSNPCPEAIELLKEHFDDIDFNWEGFSANPSKDALDLLRQYPEKIHSHAFSRNPCIFERDYIQMSEKRTMIILEDFFKNVLHPRRIIRFLELGGDMDYF